MGPNLKVGLEDEAESNLLRKDIILTLVTKMNTIDKLRYLIQVYPNFPTYCKIKAFQILNKIISHSAAMAEAVTNVLFS